MSPGVLKGEVRNLSQMTETINHKFTNEEIQEQVWRFQLERFEDGKQLPPIPVELRGQSISGVLNEGHTVILDQNTWHEGQTVVTDRVFNDSLKTPVAATRNDLRFQILVAVLMVIAFVAFAVWAFSRVANFANSFP